MSARPPRTFLVTAGPTWEAIDAVRVLSNRSTGAMGVALALAAVAAGHRVRLLLGPGCTPPPEHPALAIERFESARDLEAALARHFPEADVLVMAAAVADHRPARTAPGKLPRQAGGLSIELETVPDLVAACAARRQPHQRVVSFSLEEPDGLEERAAAKLRAKGVDAAVANPVATLGAASVSATLLCADGHRERPGACSKGEFSSWLIDRIDAMFASPRAGASSSSPRR